MPKKLVKFGDACPWLGSEMRPRLRSASYSWLWLCPAQTRWGELCAGLVPVRAGRGSAGSQEWGPSEGRAAARELGGTRVAGGKGKQELVSSLHI